MAKAKANKELTEAQVNEVLADLKKRARSGTYMDITIGVPYDEFERFVEAIVEDLEWNHATGDWEFDLDTLKVRADVRAEFERQVEDATFEDINNNYGEGFEFDMDFVEDMFEKEIAAGTEAEERREEQEEAEELARQKEREAEELRRRATLTTIEVTNENYSKALAVLKAAGLVK